MVLWRGAREARRRAHSSRSLVYASPILFLAAFCSIFQLNIPCCVQQQTYFRVRLQVYVSIENRHLSLLASSATRECATGEYELDAASLARYRLALKTLAMTLLQPCLLKWSPLSNCLDRSEYEGMLKTKSSYSRFEETHT